jgi:hypothetical protein
MASKKYKLFFMALVLLCSGAFAQTKSGYSVYDSAVIPAKRMPQQNEFWNNTYNFPAKPRNMWEIGASLGIFTITGDVPAKVLTFPNFEVHVRKAFGYIFSLRLQYMNAVGKGMQWLASENYGKNTAWRRTATNPGYSAPYRTSAGPIIFTPDGGNTNTSTRDQVYYNYKARVQDLGLQGIVTLNNIRFHKQKTGIVMYGGAGIGATLYNTMVNAYNESAGTSYAALFNGITSATYKNRKDVLDALKDGMDDTYETPAENHGERRPKIGKNTLKPSGTVLMGVAFRLGKRINLSIEDRMTFPKDDLLDGQRWQEQAYGDAGLSRDFDSFNMLSVGLNVNLGAKSVEPLWWLNPLDYAYNEFPNKKIKFPKAECADGDGDGVCDHLDNEPNTPAGCPVNTHGVTLDTDGDGVPDCKDKQLITPTECQPVDADGIGKCPDPKCCEDRGDGKDKNECASMDYPSLTMKSANLSADNKAMLSTIAAKLKASPTCNIVINGYPAPDKRSQADCTQKLEKIKNYLVEVGGISADRITTECLVDGGDKNTIDIKAN